MSEISGTSGLLARARARFERVDPAEAARQVQEGEGVLVDIRPQSLREEHGQVAADLGPLVIERNVLEWRFEPGGDWRVPQADLGRRVIILCQEGYASSLAAETLVQIGVDATDVTGGFRAWVEAGLPAVGVPSVVPSGVPAAGVPNGAPVADTVDA